MRSNSRHDRARPRGARVAAVALFALLFCVPAGWALAGTTVVEMARISAASRPDPAQVERFVAGSSDLGLREEAADFLERLLALGAIGKEDAAPLFERLAVDESRGDRSAPLLAICEAAMRPGAATTRVLYAYATALRSAGRTAEASNVLARIGPDDPVYPHALYALGQIAAERGDLGTALEIFRRVRLALAERADATDLPGRAARSEAELLLAAGRRQEAADLFRELLRATDDPFLREGLAAADNGAASGRLSPETIAAWPLPMRVRLALLHAGLALERGGFASAAADLRRTDLEIEEVLGSGLPRDPGSAAPAGHSGPLPLQMERHKAARRALDGLQGPGDCAAIRGEAVEVLAGLLLLERMLPAGAASPAAQPSGEGDDALLTIERLFLDGPTADELARRLSRRLDLLENLPHPIARYRALGGLEKRCAQIAAMRDRIGRIRASAIPATAAGDGSPAFRLLAGLGEFLGLLGEFRDAADASRQFVETHFGPARRTAGPDGSAAPPEANPVAAALRLDDRRFAALLAPAAKVEAAARLLSWEREKRELTGLRPIVRGLLADALAGEAFAMRRDDPDALSPLFRAATLLSGDQLSLRDRVGCAIRIGSFLTGETARWKPIPGRAPDEREASLAGTLIPILREGAKAGERPEEALYTAALLEMLAGSPGAVSAGRLFLERFPRSPLAGDVAIRLANIAFLAGNVREAMVHYRTAAGSPSAGASSVARYMLGWDRFAGGDPDAAIDELLVPLSDPGFPCDAPTSFDQAVLSLAARSFAAAAPGRLAAFPPVLKATCAGRHLLEETAQLLEKQGEWHRAAETGATLALRFPLDERCPAWEKRAVQNLFRAGRSKEAYARALPMSAKYGPGSAWAASRPPAAVEAGRLALRELLSEVVERTFAEGIRTGNRDDLAVASEALAQRYDLAGDDLPGVRNELRLKRAAALLRLGKRGEAVPILETLLENQVGGTADEQAALLYAETMVAGYERRERTPDEAEDAASFLLSTYPSRKAAGLALRAARALLRAEKPGRAARLCEAVAGSLPGDWDERAEAQLTLSEALLFQGDPASARMRLGALLADSSGRVAPPVRERAGDLFLLATLKEIDRRTEAREWPAAAGLLEELATRFPEKAEAPDYLLRAARAYRAAGDRDGALRAGRTVLREYPSHRDGLEAGEIVANILQEVREPLAAAGVYASLVERFPDSAKAQRFLFLSARLAGENGDPRRAAARFSAYRSKYPEPRWMAAFASLFAALDAWGSGKSPRALRDVESGLEAVEAGVEPDAPPELHALSGRARIAVGEYWAGRFRDVPLAPPMEKSVAAKDKLFRRALDAFRMAEKAAPLEVGVRASQLSGDLLLDFGNAILASRRPAGLSGRDREEYEQALRDRARSFFEKARDWYAQALDRAESQAGAPDVASIRSRLDTARTLLAGLAGQGRTP